ncbi:MAG TPA: prepilin-type N-terminal cleavage/methylation domain-containing protein [Candidatus Saccharimonadales bacterium]|nr:prepilin-type N-terminal cleavage/methylation domain-containing protein [Candidatus Saccharimonadales bacterium]
MLKNRKKLGDHGFTIIEVLIVLAIAALILLIVFLAVPALQRNARNTSRNEDGVGVLAALDEYYANNNTYPAACTGTATTIWTGTPSSSNNEGYYKSGCTAETNATGPSTTTPGAQFLMLEPTAITVGNITTDTMPPGVDSLVVVPGGSCTAGALSLGSSRTIAIEYGYETSPGNWSPKCVNS